MRSKFYVSLTLIAFAALQGVKAQEEGDDVEQVDPTVDNQLDATPAGDVVDDSQDAVGDAVDDLADDGEDADVDAADIDGTVQDTPDEVVEPVEEP